MIIFIADRHVNAPLPSLAEKGVAVRVWFEELVQRCCAKAPYDDHLLSRANFLPQLEQRTRDAVTLDLGAHAEEIQALLAASPPKDSR